MRTWAPYCDVIFPWRNYADLCIKDPSLRQSSRLKDAKKASEYSDLRDVPTIRWLQMVVYRHNVCTDMLIRLASYGHRCPAGTLDALKRLWFLLDIPTSKQRTLAIRSPNYINNTALQLLTHLFIKIDMHFTHPLGRINPPNHPDIFRFPPHFTRQGFVGSSLRQTLLGEKSLSPLWRVLRGWTWEPSEPAVHMDKLDILKLWVRHYYKPPADMGPRAKMLTVMGLPYHKLGTAQLERVNEPYTVVDDKMLAELIAHEGKDDPMSRLLRRSVNPFRTVVPKNRARGKLIRVDQLVMRESVRREMTLWESWSRMMFWGWYDPVGRKIPLWTSEELYKIRKGLPPRDKPNEKKGGELKKTDDGGEKRGAEEKKTTGEEEVEKKQK